jgi:FkbM family methyltransferase
MLIKFDHICEKYGVPLGVIHIGAHMMEEREAYMSKGLKNTVWVEANPSTYKKASEKIALEPGERFINAVVSDKDGFEVEFHVANNGESSSMLELGTHKKRHPAIRIIKTIRLHTKRIDTMIAENGIDIKDYDFLNLDIQGAELLAMKGIGDLISAFRLIYTEVNTNYLYKGCALMKEIDEYLNRFGFCRVETEITRNEWGDALYRR